MNSLKHSFLIIGAIIGAGFASGKEIFSYFARFGKMSLLFILPLFIFIYLFTYCIFCFSKRSKEKNILDANKNIWGNKSYVLSLMMFTTYLIICASMFSAIISVLNIYFDINKVILYVIAIALSYVLLTIPYKFIIKSSGIIIPFILILMLLNLSFSILNFNMQSININFIGLPFSVLFYVAQNMFLTIVLLFNSGKCLNKKEQKAVSFIVSFVLSLLVLLGVLALLNNPNICDSEMPFVEQSFNISKVFGVFYSIIIFLAILTTYYSSLTSLNVFFDNKKKINNIHVMMLLIIIVSLFNFGIIIEYLYPIIGIFGILYFWKIFFINPNTMHNKLKRLTRRE